MESRSTQDLVVLLSRSASGDRDAFRQLYEATAAKLFGTVLRILVDRDLSRDITQETYVKIWQHAARFDPSRSSPITWMMAIARNRALDEARKRQPATVAIDDENLQLADEFRDPLRHRARSEALHRLLACLDGLDEDKRQAVLLAYYHGASREALARRFSRPIPTIKTWLHRSLAQLKRCLEQ